MKVAAAIAEILKREGVEFLIGYPAIKRGIEKTREGRPVLLEFITEKAVNFSRFA